MVQKKREQNWKQKPHGTTFKCMEAFLVTVLPLYQVNVKTIPHRESQLMFDKDWGYVLSSEPQKLRYGSTLIDVFRVPFKEREAERRAKNRFMWYTSFNVLQ